MVKVAAERAARRGQKIDNVGDTQSANTVPTHSFRRQSLNGAMRQQGICEQAKVDAVVLETEGSLSVLEDSAASRQELRELGVDVSDSFRETRLVAS
ncbi:MAG: hypothetical protein R3C59_16085 [Planctomycetaceae bacterium]